MDSYPPDYLIFTVFYTLELQSQKGVIKIITIYSFYPGCYFIFVWQHNRSKRNAFLLNIIIILRVSQLTQTMNNMIAP